LVGCLAFFGFFFGGTASEGFADTLGIFDGYAEGRTDIEGTPDGAAEGCPDTLGKPEGAAEGYVLSWYE